MREDTLEFRGALIRELPRRNQTYAPGRSCSEATCNTKLSIYNRSTLCWQHEPVRSYVTRGKRRRREAA